MTLIDRSLLLRAVLADYAMSNGIESVYNDFYEPLEAAKNVKDPDRYSAHPRLPSITPLLDILEGLSESPSASPRLNDLSEDPYGSLGDSAWPQGGNDSYTYPAAMDGGDAVDLTYAWDPSFYQFDMYGPVIKTPQEVEARVAKAEQLDLKRQWVDKKHEVLGLPGSWEEYYSQNNNRSAQLPDNVSGGDIFGPLAMSFIKDALLESQDHAKVDFMTAKEQPLKQSGQDDPLAEAGPPNDPLLNRVLENPRSLVKNIRNEFIEKKQGFGVENDLSWGHEAQGSTQFPLATYPASNGTPLMKHDQAFSDRDGYWPASAVITDDNVREGEETLPGKSTEPIQAEEYEACDGHDSQSCVHSPQCHSAQGCRIKNRKGKVEVAEKDIISQSTQDMLSELSDPTEYQSSKMTDSDRGSEEITPLPEVQQKLSTISEIDEIKIEDQETAGDMNSILGTISPSTIDVESYIGFGENHSDPSEIMHGAQGQESRSSLPSEVLDDTTIPSHIPSLEELLMKREGIKPLSLIDPPRASYPPLTTPNPDRDDPGRLTLAAESAGKVLIEAAQALRQGKSVLFDDRENIEHNAQDHLMRDNAHQENTAHPTEERADSLPSNVDPMKMISSDDLLAAISDILAMPFPTSKDAKGNLSDAENDDSYEIDLDLTNKSFLEHSPDSPLTPLRGMRSVNVRNIPLLLDDVAKFAHKAQDRLIIEDPCLELNVAPEHCDEYAFTNGALCVANNANDGCIASNRNDIRAYTENYWWINFSVAMWIIVAIGSCTCMTAAGAYFGKTHSTRYRRTPAVADVTLDSEGKSMVYPKDEYGRVNYLTGAREEKLLNQAA